MLRMLQKGFGIRRERGREAIDAVAWYLDKMIEFGRFFHTVLQVR